jgi:hypothetical protein
LLGCHRGIERRLAENQKAVLGDANRHPLRIVGFDWLANRARIIAANVTLHPGRGYHPTHNLTVRERMTVSGLCRLTGHFLS